MLYIKWGFVFFALLFEMGFSKTLYELNIKNAYSIKMGEYPDVGTVTSDYIRKLNSHPIQITTPDSGIVKIVQNYFMIWEYHKYSFSKKKYDKISIFKYESTGTNKIYFFYLNVLLQLDLGNKKFKKVTFFGNTNKINYEAGTFTITKEDPENKSTRKKKDDEIK